MNEGEKDLTPSAVMYVLHTMAYNDLTKKTLLNRTKKFKVLGFEEKELNMKVKYLVNFKSGKTQTLAFSTNMTDVEILCNYIMNYTNLKNPTVTPKGNKLEVTKESVEMLIRDGVEFDLDIIFENGKFMFKEI
jgi:hypothetical protein